MTVDYVVVNFTVTLKRKLLAYSKATLFINFLL